MTFKVGDKVRRSVNPVESIGMVVGRVYTVTKQLGDLLYVDGIDNYSFAPQYFELVEPAPYGFMVHRGGGRPPGVIHKTVELAQAEAERLSNQYPGITFKVLELMPRLDVITEVIPAVVNTKVTPL